MVSVRHKKRHRSPWIATDGPQRLDRGIPASSAHLVRHVKCGLVSNVASLAPAETVFAASRRAMHHAARM